VVISLRYLLDTNTIIYLQSGRLTEPLPNGEFLISVITQMELLSYPDLNQAESAKLHEFFESVGIIQLDSAVQSEAVMLRKKYRRRMPDAIIAASSKIADATLLTADDDFQKMAEIRVEKVKFR
jgi:predicted nucleic acid-binding protein